MEHGVDLSLDIDEIRDVIWNEPEFRIAEEMGYVVGASGEKIIQANNFVPFRDKPVAEMGSDESGAAGY